MDNREIQALEHLKIYCFQLYQFRDKQIAKWPYDGLNGPTIDEVELMIGAYASNIDPNIKKANPLLSNPYSTEYALEIYNKISGFLAFATIHPDQIDNTALEANTLGPSIIYAYEQHLKDVQAQKQAKAQKVRFHRPPLFGERLEEFREIREEEIRQNLFLVEIDNKRQEIADQIKPVVDRLLQNPQLLSSLTPSQRNQLAQEIPLIMMTVTENEEVKKFFLDKMASGETPLSLFQKFQKNKLPPNEQALFSRFVSLNLANNSPLDPAMVSQEAAVRVQDLLKNKYQTSAPEISAFTAELGKATPQYQNLLVPAVSLQNLSVTGLNPDVSRLTYLYQIDPSQRTGLPIKEKIVSFFGNFLSSQGLKDYEGKYVSQRLYTQLYDSYLAAADKEFTRLSLTETKDFITKNFVDFASRDPYVRAQAKKTGMKEEVFLKHLETDISNALDNQPDFILTLKAVADSHYSARASPNHLPENLLYEDHQTRLRHFNSYLTEDVHGKEYKSFFGRLTPQFRLMIMAIPAKKIDETLDYLAQTNRIQFAKRQEISFDPLQTEQAIKLLGFLKDHPRLHKYFFQPLSFIKKEPILSAAVSTLASDPSYFGLFLQQAGKYLIQTKIIEYKEFILKPNLYAYSLKYLGINLALPLKDQVKNLPFFKKLLAGLWVEDKYGYLHFAFTDPKKWAETTIKKSIYGYLYNQYHYGFIKKLIVRPVIKLIKKWFGKAAARTAFKVAGQVVGALLGLAIPGPGWIATVIFAYSLLRDIFPQLKKVEQALLAGVGLLIYGAFSLVAALFKGIAGVAGGALSVASSVITGVTSGVGVGIGGAAATIAVSALGGVAALTSFNSLVTHSAFVEYQETYAPVFYSNCYVKDIHKTDVVTEENKQNFVAKFKALFPKSLIEEKIDEVILKSKTAGFNPALAVAIWGEESHFSNYGSSGGESNVVEGYDFGCGVKCSEGKPNNFDESLGCFVANKPSCNNLCLSKPDFKEFMECYGPAAENPNFISNVLVFYRELVPSGPDALECPGGTTGTFASQLINHLIDCYDNGGVINNRSLNDNGNCLKDRGVPGITVAHIVGSVSQLSALQCVGFAKAVEAGTGAGSGFANASLDNAKDYFQELPGYQLIQKGEQNVMVGDLAFFSGEYGHVGVVIETASDMSWFRIAQAIGVAPDGSWYGLVNESGPIHTTTWPNLLGFLRRK